MRIVAISDTHERHGNLVLPEGDVLVHAGDLTGNGNMTALVRVAEWIQQQPFRHRVCIAGNHDWCFERAYERRLARCVLSDHGWEGRDISNRPSFSDLVEKRTRQK